VHRSGAAHDDIGISAWDLPVTKFVCLDLCGVFH